MAGSYNHVVGKTGKLLSNTNFVDMIENLGDAYEMAKDMYGMIWYLANGNVDMVEEAKVNVELGIRLSPGVQRER